MIRVVEINNLDDANKLLLDRRYDASIGRLRSNYLYRGVPSSSYELQTSLFRNCGNKQEVLEPSILRYFRKYAITDEPEKSKSVWKQMMVGQHYGLPTRLLDWTHSSLIAMHFATSEAHIADTGRRDGVVWRIDVRELKKLLPVSYSDALKAYSTDFFSADMLESIAPTLRDYDVAMGNSAMAIIEPTSIDQRIINQYSYFSIIPMGMENIEKFLDENTENTVKYIIKKDVRWNVRDILDQLNISERICFPGLDGLSKWIARHYFVRSSASDQEDDLHS